MTDDDQKSCMQYRQMVRALIRDYTQDASVEPDENFKLYLQTNHAQYSADLMSMERNGETGNRVQAIRNGLFVLASGLFVYGELDKADDMLAYLPSSGGVRQLALALPALLPLTIDFYVWDDVDAVRSWLEQHRLQLQWSETAGAYLHVNRACATLDDPA